MKYVVKFEVFDKKLKVSVDAASEIDALEYVKEAIKIHSIVSVQPNTSKTYSEPQKNGNVEDWEKYLNDMFAGLDKMR